MARGERSAERSRHEPHSPDLRRRSRDSTGHLSERESHRRSRHGPGFDADASPRRDRARHRSPDDRKKPPRRRYEDRERSMSSGRRDRKRSTRYDDRDDQVVKRTKGSRSPSTQRHRDRSRDRSRDRKKHSRREISRSRESPHRRSPPPKRRRRSHSASRASPPGRSRGPLPSQLESFTGTSGGPGELEKPIEKQKPNFSATGLLAKEANTVVGTSTVLKYHEPPEARKPPSNEQWRMFIFKGKETLDTVPLSQRSCWLMGRDQAVADLHLEHPSISKQHAVIQFRYMPKKNEYGDRMDSVKPYLIDLDSSNGTRLNDKKIEGSRFVELRDGDVVGFGDSEREYVLMLPPADE